MVAKDKADAIVQDWSGRYQKAYPDWASKAQFFLTDAGPAAFEL
jgi:hypothetical protein